MEFVLIAVALYLLSKKKSVPSAGSSGGLSPAEILPLHIYQYGPSNPGGRIAYWSNGTTSVVPNSAGSGRIIRYEGNVAYWSDGHTSVIS